MKDRVTRHFLNCDLRFNRKSVCYAVNIISNLISYNINEFIENKNYLFFLFYFIK